MVTKIFCDDQFILGMHSYRVTPIKLIGPLQKLKWEKMPIRLRLTASGIALAVAALAPVHAQEKIFWELGIGLSALSFPDYSGSDQRNLWLLPFPYLTYRSERFIVDRNSASGEILETTKLKLTLSLSGSIPVDSDDNRAREGMPDLDPVVELGPSLQYEMYASAAQQDRLFIELPLRSAFAVDWKAVRHIGWISNPNVQYQKSWEGQDGIWKLTATSGPLFGDRRYHHYFFGVDRRFATPERPVFETSGGYGGWRFSAGFSRRKGRLWYGGFIRYINLSGANFDASPLVKTRHSLIGGMGIAWIFAGSNSAAVEY